MVTESGDDPAAGQEWPAHLERRRWCSCDFRRMTSPKEQFQSWRSHMAPLVDVHLPEALVRGYEIEGISIFDVVGYACVT
ncbi:hypothetical protein [Rhizobium leguminosarum]|uniref:hypothetical protein n=1 Tax=Rhizobium leguminosarum TaxID=384 RepID=UPI00269A3C88